MSENRDVREQAGQDARTRADEDSYLRPPVDIFEDAGGITLRADLPGVSPERLEIHVDGDTLSIEGQAFIDMPEGMEALYADVKTTRFRRSFTLSSELDSEKINAGMKDGVLTLKLPKRAELQPRKIEIKAG
jgi:HSP20 family molecular chaperone IbpA